MEPFIAQIIMFGGNFAPRGWALCDGQTLPINSNQALFSILGTTYGGNGRTDFRLPDLRGRVPMHPGTGPGLQPRRLGDVGGEESVILNQAEIPAHSHAGTLAASSLSGNADSPINAVPAVGPDNDFAASADGVMAGGALSLANTGGGQGHPNVQPFQCVNYIIALTGIFPSRS